MRALELKIPPVVTVLFFGALMFTIARLVPVFGFALPARWIIAAALALAGMIAASLGVVSFRRVRTTVNPMRPENASHLVISGINRRTRNPMYLGMLLVLLGWGVFLSNALALVLALVFIPLMNSIQIGPEERILAEHFGAKFEAYRSTVRRWL